jgi:hypothetical protein
MRIGTAVGNGRATVAVTEPVSYRQTVLAVQTVSQSVQTDTVQVQPG